MSKKIEEAAREAIIDNDFFMADPNHPEFVDRGLEQMRACKWVINHIFSLPLASRLTAEEKERIRKEYADTFPNDPDQSITSIRVMHTLERIFGKDFFKENKL